LGEIFAGEDARLLLTAESWLLF